ncbi:omptin family outer membrane protease [Paracoccus sp. (in: a-proteobacteria)]|uniref:omptin family outer membrane protease n=1 Tax=Paracoccus sp. TaxID=267 RepID=UPI0026E0CA06|nr:omptin family outer membrane protease [Paracoccus sp. (in: a-proteobacteria)]MDO5647734.1 omptin family outer membrane protease [Paracoccus sp. (in: a-proteobacteria)]
MRAICALSLILSAGMAVAETPDRVVWGGFGVTNLRADEIVYDGDHRLSLLEWRSSVPTVTVGVKRRFDGGWTLGGQMVANMGQTGRMTDYDWEPTFMTGTGKSGWSDWSTHPDTRLNQYFDFTLTGGREVTTENGTRLNLHGGVKYVRADWTAHGGRYVYSEDALRDTTGTFPAGQAVVTYRQRHTTIFAGVDAARDLGDWTISGGLRGGVSVAPRDTDFHWLRNLRFDSRFDPMPYAGVTLRADYRINDRLTGYAQADYDQHFRRRGDTVYSEIVSGARDGGTWDTSGAAMRAATLSVGLAARF